MKENKRSVDSSLLKRFIGLFQTTSNVKTKGSLIQINESFVLVDKKPAPIEPIEEEEDRTNFNDFTLDENSDCLDEMSNLNRSCSDSININELPVELICQILSYLEVSERKNASLVCKKWRFAFLNSHFLNDVLIKANNCLFISRPASSNPIQKTSKTNGPHRSSIALSSYSSSTSVSQFHYCLYKNAVNLEFENDSADVTLLLKNLTNLNESSSASTEWIFPCLKNLSFIKTNMSSKSLIDLIRQAPNLNSIHLVYCDSLFMTGFLSYTSSSIQQINLKLIHLTELNLSKNRYLTDNLLNFFVNLTPCLTSLDISYCCLTKSKFKSLSNNELTLNNNSNVVLTLENLQKLFTQQLTKLRSINFSGIDLFNHDDEALTQLVSKLTDLEVLKLAQLPNLKVETVSTILQKCIQLKHIDLDNSIQIDDINQKTIESILETMKTNDLKSNLKFINLRKARINNPQMLMENICYFNNLIHLDLSCALFQRSFSTAARLNQYIDSFACNLAECDRLEVLDLSYCDFLVNDSFIKIITKKLIRLKRLDLRNCSSITDVSLHFITYFLCNLNYLDISWCQNLSDNGLDLNIEFEASKKLLNEFNKHLNGSCRCMRKYLEQPFLLMKTKAQILMSEKAEFCKCNGVIIEHDDPNKKELDFKMLKQLDANLINENFSLKSLKNLKVLKMEACVNITDDGLINGLNLYLLSELDIKLCTNIAGDFVKLEQTTTKNLKFNNLKSLNLNQCVKFREENLISIVQRSPNLKELSVSAVTSISNRLVDILLREKRLLSLLDVSFCPNCSETEIDKYEQFLFNEFGTREFNLDKRFISK